MAEAGTAGTMDAGGAVSEKGIAKIIAASSVGTMVEWYDFYIFGSLATVIASKFYQTGTPLGDMIAWLAAFAVGFIVRPFGAIVFGRVGDLIGRKYTFLVTMLLMGLCTFAVGLLPTIDTIGPIAGVILIVLRILQGLALGGEYGGAATYVAEHSPDRKRGFYTSWIQITATGGLFMSLGVILATRQYLGEAVFNDWGWRVPFLVSALLVLVSLYIRISLKESPLFAGLKKKGGLSKNPIKESFTNPFNLKWVMLALLGATMGQGVVWYTGQFYALFYLQKVFHVALVPSNVIVAGALLAATPLFVFFGWLSDRIGRKRIMLAGMILAVVTWYPLYGLMAASAPSAYKAAPADLKGVKEVVDKGGNPGTKKIVRDESQATVPAALTKITSSNVVEIPATELKEGDKVVVKFQPFLFPYTGYNEWILAICVFFQVVYVTMVYGPIAAFLVELFPTNIRYTSMSLPYHIGNGVFGGLVPIIGLSLLEATKNNYAGLWYPMAVAGICAVVCAIYIKETNHIDIHAGESIAHHSEHGTNAPLKVASDEA